MNALRDWALGYCITRQYMTPVAVDEDWLWFRVGKPDQRERFVYLGSDPQRFCARFKTITDAFVFVDMAGPREAVSAGVSESWVFRDRAYLMETLFAQPVIEHGRRLDISAAGGRIECIGRAEDGAQAARGLVGVREDVAVYDQIVTEPDHRRKGFGTAIMAELMQRAAERGARRHLLIATPDGRALYETMGWRVVSEITSVISG